jgi:hypothetical protein
VNRIGILTEETHEYLLYNYHVKNVWQTGVLPFVEQATSVRTAFLVTRVARKGLYWHF